MADQEHLDILSQGVKAWNTWRVLHPEVVEPDLRSASLTRADLTEADLTRANFTEASLREADLTRANLTHAYLTHAYLTEADLTRANLTHANLTHANLRDAYLTEADLRSANLTRASLTEADLTHADLTRANLTEADLTDANLMHANLTEADLTEATLGWTVFGNIDLSAVKGLDTVRHHGPSTIGIDTIYRSQSQMPERFLRGAGVPDIFIDYMHSLVTTGIEYYSCFISYSSQDHAFAERLHADLQNHNVRCWFAPHDMRIGEPIVRGIDQSIRLHDKLLLILSEAALSSNWVEYEVQLALTREQTEQRTVLFPVRLDDAVLHTQHWWPARIMTRHIGDFTHWKNHDDYQQVFQRLLRDLKAQNQASTG